MKSMIGYHSTVVCQYITSNGLVAGMRGNWLMEIVLSIHSYHGCSYGDLSDNIWNGFGVVSYLPVQWGIYSNFLAEM